MVFLSSGLARRSSSTPLKAADLASSHFLSGICRCRRQAGQLSRIRFWPSGMMGTKSTTKKSVVSYDSSSVRELHCEQTALTRWMRRLPQYQVPTPLTTEGMAGILRNEMHRLWRRAAPRGYGDSSSKNERTCGTEAVRLEPIGMTS